MNIFYLDSNPKKSAIYHNDKHVVKMILEYAQILSTAHRVLDGYMYIEKTKNNRNIKRYRLHGCLENILYKATHVNHPCSIWARSGVENYTWLYEMFCHLCDEYTHRYGKIHASDIKLRKFLCHIPKNISNNKWTEPHQAMPEYCKDVDSIIAYRNYYIFEKKGFNNYRNRKVPEWLIS